MGNEVLGQNLATDQVEIFGDGGEDISYQTFIQSYVGEGKKFKTPEEALVALAKKAAHADTFIETLKLEKRGVETENEKLAAAVEQAKKIDDLMSMLSADPPAVSAQTATLPTATAQSEQLQDLVAKMLAAEKEKEASQRAAAQVKENQDKAWKSLEEAFGGKDQAKLAVRTYVGENEARKDILNRMGSYIPDDVVSFLKLQLKGDDRFQGSGESQRRTTENLSLDNGQLTWAKVQQIRKDNPSLYKSRKFQLQIHQAAAANPNFWK